MSRQAHAPVEIGDDEPVRGKVYFVLDQGMSALKIGYSVDIPKRLADLRTSSPGDLALVGYVRGSRAVEAAMHAHLRSERIRGEWFRMSEKTTDLIDEIADFLSGFDTDDADGRDERVITVEDIASIVSDPTYGMTVEQIYGCPDE